MTYLYLIFVFFLGLSVGSFINCFVWRIYKEESLMNRSYCPKCKNQIFWYDNIPILSYFLLGGKCRHCHKKISIQYPLVELVFSVLFLLVFVKNFYIFDVLDLDFVLTLFRDWFFLGVVVFIFIFDFKWYLIPDIITLPSIFIIIIINLFLSFSWQSVIISALLGGGFFLIQFLISKGKWIGGGDIRLGLLMGVYFAKVNNLLLAIFISYLIGSVVGLSLMIFGKKKWGSELPLGVFLALGSVIAYFFGQDILTWYFNL